MGGFNGCSCAFSLIVSLAGAVSGAADDDFPAAAATLPGGLAPDFGDMYGRAESVNAGAHLGDVLASEED
jgi:hypothetical protein